MHLRSLALSAAASVFACSPARPNAPPEVRTNLPVTGLTSGHVFQREQAETEKNEVKYGVRGVNPGHVISRGRHQRFGAFRAQIDAWKGPIEPVIAKSGKPQ